MEPINAGEMNWEANWRQIVETRRQSIEALGNQGPQSGYWDRRAERFARMTREFELANDPFGSVLLEELRPSDSVLDVGAGAGRHSIALASIVRLVTAVEPATTMLAHLEAEAERRGFDNVVVVASAWEEAAVEPHDIVLASHVLYPIAEAVTFLRKLDAATRRVCYITLRVDDMVPQIAPLWHAVWGRERPREPGFLDLYNLLFALGIRPDVQLVPFGSGLGFETLDDAVDHVRQLLFLPPETHEHDGRIRAFLETVLRKGGERLILPNATQAAIVSWKKAVDAR
ncbi:MAG: class I SAM-dependent methyltransferase [Herpetosiphon sp.]